MACINATDVTEALSEFYTLEEIDEWLDTPQVLLGGKTATALIMAGRKSEVLDLIQALRDGVYL